MNITEKATVTYHIKFTEDDYKLIVYVLKRVWSFAKVDTLIDNYARPFAKILQALDAVRDNFLYSSDITSDDKDILGVLDDACCTFEVRHANDERFADVDDLWKKIVHAKDPARE